MKYYITDYDYSNQKVFNQETDELIGYIVKLNAKPGEMEWGAFLPGMVGINVQAENSEKCAEKLIRYLSNQKGRTRKELEEDGWHFIKRGKYWDASHTNGHNLVSRSLNKLICDVNWHPMYQNLNGK